MKISYAITVALCVMALGSLRQLGAASADAIAARSAADGDSAATPDVASSMVAAEGLVSPNLALPGLEPTSIASSTASPAGGAEQGLGTFWQSLVRRNEDPNAEPWKRAWWRGALATGAFAGSTWMSFRGLRSLAGRLAIGPLRTAPMLLRGAIAAGIVDIGRLLLIEVVPNLAVFLYDQLGLDSRFGLFGGKEIAGQEVARTARIWTSRLFAAGTSLTLTVAQEIGGLFWGHDPVGLKEVFVSNYREWFERIDYNKEKVWNFFGVRAPSEANNTAQTDWWQGIKEAGKLTGLGASADSARKATSKFDWSDLPIDLPFIGNRPAQGLSMGAMAPLYENHLSAQSQP